MQDQRQKRSPTVVIAGSFQEFLGWCRVNKVCPTQAIYADSNERIMGLELAENDIVFTGQHWLNKIDRGLLQSRIRR